MDIFQELSDIFKDVLDNKKLHITRETSASDVEEWDSLNHIQLVVAIEKHFKIKFSAQEIRNWTNVGELCDSVSAKLQKG